MNFNLKKYLVLSIAGLAVCGMQSNAAQWSSYYNNTHKMDSNYNSSSQNYFPSIIQIKNRQDEIVNTDALSSLNVQKFVHHLVGRLENRDEQAQASALIHALKFKDIGLWSDLYNCINAFILERDIGSELLTLLNDSVLYNKQVLDNIDNILGLVKFVGEIQQYNLKLNNANSGQQGTKFVFFTLDSEDLFSQLWNTLIKVDDCAQLYDNLLNFLKQNLANNVSDCCLAGLLASIYNFTTDADSNNCSEFIQKFSYLFNKKSVFATTKNQKVGLVSSLNKQIVSLGILELFKNGLGTSQALSLVKKIGCPIALSNDEILVLSAILQNKDVTKIGTLGEQRYKINNFYDLILWVIAQLKETSNGDGNNDSNSINNQPTNPVVDNSDTLINPLENNTQTNTNTGLLRNQNQQPKPLNNDDNQLPLHTEDTESPVVRPQFTFKPINNNTNETPVKPNNVENNKPIVDPIIKHTNTPAIDDPTDNNKNEYLKITGLEGKFGAGVKIKSIKAYKEAPAGAAVVYHANSMKKDLSEIRPVNQSCQVVFKFNDGRFARDYLETPIIKNGIGVVRGNHEILNNKLLMDEVNKVANWHQGNFLVFDLVKE